MPHSPPKKKAPPKHAVMQLDRNNHAVYVAYCPAHGRRSSNHQGETEHGSQFRCTAGPTWLTHLFTVPPDPEAPRPEGITEWMQKQLEKKAVQVGRGTLQ